MKEVNNMKVYNHLYRDKRKFNVFLNGTGLDRENQALVRIHSSIYSPEELSALAGDIKELLPNANIIGRSTPGVICDGKIIKDSCLVSITTFGGCNIDTFYSGTPDNEKELCAQLSEQLVRKKTNLCCFFPLLIPGG